jgi:signal transduction histidine kinase/AmiR/NasT family two-component response regulator
MSDPTFEEIFDELVEVDGEQRDFLEKLHRLFPAEGFELQPESPAARVLNSGTPVEIEAAARHSLILKARETDGVVVDGSAPGGHFFARKIERYNAVLLGRLPPGNEKLLQAPSGAELIGHAIALALLEQEQQSLFADKEQAQRQITILKEQHGKLIEDNFRQYQLNQQKEKEYARKLESEIARQTAELREANARLEEISRLKSEFLANMSHELRTPMNAIIGFSELLTETSLSDEQTEYAKTIRQSAHSLLSLINDILDLAKIEAGKLELEQLPFDLSELLVNVVSLFKLTAQAKNVLLECRVDSRLPRGVLGDSNRLRQVLVNLTGNAMKFTEQGRIDLAVDWLETREDEVVIRFTVRDTGIGIPEHRLKAVFEKFTQADGSTTRKFGGTGLGLSICQELVELMGGTITIESREGIGSSFSFTLPMKMAVVGKLVAKPEEGKAPVAGPGKIGGRVLLVEDNIVNQRLAMILIGKQGYEVRLASDGLEAMERLRQENFDLVLMDVQMPNLDGLSATRKIREIEADPVERKRYAGLSGPESPVIIIGLTAHARKEDEEACYEAGMNGFLTKPIIKDKLLRIMQEKTSR